MSNTIARDSNGSAGSRDVGAQGQGRLGDKPRTGVSSRTVRKRSPGLVAAAGVLVMGSGLGVAAWGLYAGQKESVIEVGAHIAKGHVIGREELVSESVAGVHGAIPVAQIDSVVGKTAAVDLVPGQVLTASMFTSVMIPGPGHSTVGLALDPTRVPSAGLDTGDVVDVVAVPDADTAKSDATTLDSPTVLARGAEVYGVRGAATSGGTMLVTLVVAADDADRVAAYSTQNRVALVETAPVGAAKSTTQKASR